MTIFERIQTKAQQALTGVGNFIDRDKSMSGVQITPGGIGAGINRAKAGFQNPFNQMQQGVDPFGQPLPPVAKQLTQAMGGVGNFGLNVLQAPPRIAGELTLTAMGQKELQPSTPIEKILFGEESLKSLGHEDRFSRQIARTAGVSPEMEPYFAAPFIVAGIASDIVPVGAGGKQATKTGAKTVGQNAAKIDDLLTGQNAKKVAENLDFLPKYADELRKEVDELTRTIKNHRVLSQINELIPSKTKLQTMLNQKRAELREVTKQIEQITKQKPLKNQATMIAGSEGVIPLKQPLNSTQQLDDVLNKTQGVKPGGVQPGSNEILLLPESREKRFQDLLDQSRDYFSKPARPRVPKQTPDENLAMKTLREYREAQNPEFYKAADDVLENTPPKLTTEIKEVASEADINSVSDFAEQASKQDLNTGNKFTRKIREIFLDTEDNLRRTFKESYKQFEPVMETFRTRIKEGSVWTKSYQNQAIEILNDLNIKVGSEEDKLIRMFQQKNGLQRVAQRVGPERAAQLNEAYLFLRSKYDEIHEFVNAQREAAGLNLLPYKGDTFLSQQGSRSGSSFDFLLEGLPKQADTASSTIFKKQNAPASTGAFESFAKYLESAQKAGFTDLSGKEIRDIANALGEAGVDTNAVKQLYKLSQNILGDKMVNPVLKTIENVTGKMAGAKVLGKASTLVSQTLSLPQAFGRDPISFVRGNFKAGAFKDLRSKSRVLDVVSQTVPARLRTGNPYTKAVGFSGDVLVKAQDITNRMIFNTYVDRALKMGLPEDEAVKWADQELVKIVGDRRLSMAPEVYSTFIGNIFGRFTLEPTAAITRLVKDVGDKNFGKVLGTLVAWHIGNKVNEKYGTGFAPFPDPWQAVVDSGEFALGSEDKEQDNLKAVTRLVSEALQTMPIINNMFNTGYSIGETAGIFPDSRDVMGDDQTWMNVGSLYNPLSKWDRNITGNKAVDVPWSVASNTLPFFEQAARTTQAANTLRRGYAESKGGSPMYEAPTGLDAGRALLFGQSSSQNARDFFNNDYAGWLSKKDQRVLDSLSTKEDKLDFLRSAQSRQENVNRIKGKSIESVLSGGTGIKPSSKAERQAIKEHVNTLLEAGQVPDRDDMVNGLFNGYTAKSTSIQERMDVYSTLNTALSDEYITPEQREALIKASGADPKNVDYYTLASKDQDVRLQEMLPKLDNMDTDEMVKYLMTGRRAVGGKQLVSNAMVDYLYEMDYLSDSERKAIKALKYDEINDKFYYSKSYKGSGGGGRMSYSQAEKLYNMSLPKFSQLKSLDFLLSLHTGGAQTNTGDDRLLSNILNAPVQKNTNNNLWF